MGAMMGKMMGGGGGGMGGGMGGMQSMMKGMMGGGHGGGAGAMPHGGMMGDPNHMHLPHMSLRKMLKDLDKVESKGLSNPRMAAMAIALKHQILDKVSCITGCMYHKNEHGLCYEQSCVFHYQPGLTEHKDLIKCADELSIMAMSKEAEGPAHFAVKAYAVEPDDDMLPTQMYDHMDTKYKYQRRLKDGTLEEATTQVCHNVTCAEHPPPVEISAGDTLYFTVVALDESGNFKHLHPGSFRVVAIGSETGKSCNGAMVGAGGLRGKN